MAKKLKVGHMNGKVGHLKIVKETPEKCVKMDVEMDDIVINHLLNYADEEMDEKERKSLMINWAFNDMLAKSIKKELLTCGKVK